MTPFDDDRAFYPGVRIKFSPCEQGRVMRQLQVEGRAVRGLISPPQRLRGTQPSRIPPCN